MRASRSFLATLLSLFIFGAACGQEDTATAANQEPAAAQPATDSPGIRVVSAADAAATIDSPPDNLVILDVRTAEEFDEGHLEGAIMLDFYRDDFAEQLAQLDPTISYVLYCRSGNRSGQTTELMRGLGFADVEDIDGGILAWSQDGYNTVPG